MGLSGNITTVLNFDGNIRSGLQTKIGKNIDIYRPNILSPTEDDDEIIKKYNDVNKFNSIVFFVHTKN